MESTPVEQKENQDSRYLYMELSEIDSMMDEMEELIWELSSKSNQLPLVDENGLSECPFAEDLYVYKERAARDVEIALEELRPCILPINNEISRCYQNIGYISFESQNLNSEKAKDNFDQAKNAQEKQHEGVVFRKERFLALIEMAEIELEKAAEKKWPLGEPKETDRFNPEAVLNSVVDGTFDEMRTPIHMKPKLSKPALNTEIDNLISLGPIK